MIELFNRGGPVMIPLLICSVTGLTVIVERCLFWIRESRRRDPALVDEVLSLAEQEAYDGIQKRVRGTRDFVVRVLVSGILHREFSLTSAMEVAAREELRRMTRYLPVLDTLITLSPMLGILGTVTGIIQSFDLLSTTGIREPQAVTGGIAQALITTAAGLTVALFCLIPYNFFMKKAEKAAFDMETYGTSLEIVYRKNRHHPVEGAPFRAQLENVEGHLT